MKYQKRRHGGLTDSIYENASPIRSHAQRKILLHLISTVGMLATSSLINNFFFFFGSTALTDLGRY